MCISAAMKPTFVLEMWAAPTISAVGFQSMPEATEPSLSRFIRYHLLSLCYFLLYYLDVTLTISQYWWHLWTRMVKVGVRNDFSFCLYFSARMPSREDSPDDGGGGPGPLYQIQGDLPQPAHPARAGGTSEDLWSVFKCIILMLYNHLLWFSEPWTLVRIHLWYLFTSVRHNFACMR